LQASFRPTAPRIVLLIGAGLVFYAAARLEGWWPAAGEQERSTSAASPRQEETTQSPSSAFNAWGPTQAAAPAPIEGIARLALEEAARADATNGSKACLAESGGPVVASWESVRPELFQTLRNQLAGNLGSKFDYNNRWLRGGLQKLAWRTVLALEAQPYGGPAPSYTQMLQQLEAQLPNATQPEAPYRRALAALLERKLERGEFEVTPPPGAEPMPKNRLPKGPGKGLFRLFAKHSDWTITLQLWQGEDAEVDAARPNAALALRACITRALTASGHVLPEAEIERLLADRGPGPR
jgi:hypothetical protein